MNLSKVSAVLATCVAVALSLSACALPVNAGALEPKPEPPASTAPSDTYDEWVNWTAGTKTKTPAEYEESVHSFSEQLGLGTVFEQPVDVYSNDGWAGVAQYGSLCIIALEVDEQSAVDGSVALTILSRYDDSLVVMTGWSADYERMRTSLAPYTQWCKTGGPIPFPADDGVIPPQEQTLTA